MANGTKKLIKDVELGDEVMATDPITGETGPRKVVDLIRHGRLHTMVAVELSDGTRIEATDEHPAGSSREASGSMRSICSPVTSCSPLTAAGSRSKAWAPASKT